MRSIAKLFYKIGIQLKCISLVWSCVFLWNYVKVTESCARATVYTRKGAYDMFDFLASRHRRPPRGEHDSDDDSDDDDHGEEVRKSMFQ